MLATKATTPKLDRKARSLWQAIQTTVPVVQTTLPRIDVAALATYAQHFDKRAEDLALQLATGEMSVNQWRNAMAREVENLHVTGAVIGRGGVDGLSERELRAVRRRIGEQKQYLDNWALELTRQRNQGADFDPAKVYQRARMYGGAVNDTVYEANTRAVGIPRLSNYPGDGRTRCLTNCRCALSIKKLAGDGDWDIYWKLGKAEHCEDCIELARRWNPLRVRKGVIQA